MEDNTKYEVELPASTDPAPVGPLRGAAPTGTSFNKKTVMIMGAIVGCLFAFGILMAFSPKKQNAAVETMAPAQEQPSYQVTPEQIASMPSTYQNPETGNYPPLGPPAPVSPGYENPYGNYGQTGPTYVVPEPQFVDEYGHPYGYTNSGGGEQIAEVRKSPIRFGGPSSAVSVQIQTPQNNDPYDPYMNSLNMMDSQEQQKHPQDEKREFMAASHNSTYYSQSKTQAPLSPFELKAGAIIPAVLITGINSDLPGYITAQVRENVFDTVSGKHLLIPQGTRMIGVYDSKIQYGQGRVMTVWTRLIFPNGNSIDLENMSGIDRGGYSGFQDRVNNHWGKLITGAVFTSVLSAGAKVASGDPNQINPSYEQLAASGAGENIANIGVKVTEKNLGIQPTIEVRPGYRFNLFVQKDFILAPYK